MAELAAEIQNLHHKNDPESYQSPDPSATFQWYKGVLSDPQSTVFLAEINGQAVGHIVLLLKESQTTPLVLGRRFVELLELGVVDGHQDKGIGTSLHEKAIKHCRALGIVDLRLTVSGFNKKARDFYRNRGFVLQSEGLRLQLP